MEPDRNRRSRLRFGQFEADLSEGKLYDRGRHVRLESQPFQVLAALLERPGDVIAREELRARLWSNGTYVDFDDGLNTAVSKLRAALHDSKETPVFVETIPRRGYRFLAPISEVKDGNDGSGSGVLPVPLSPSSPEMTVNHEVGATSNSPRRVHIASVGVVGLALILISLGVLVVVAGWAVHRWRLGTIQSVNQEAMEIRKLTDTGNVDAVAISPDSRYVIYARRIGEMVSLRMRQIESLGDVEILPATQANIAGLTFSPDGDYLYFVRSNLDDPGLKDLYVMPALGGPFRKLIHDIDSPISFSPDGRKFVFTVGYPMKNQIEVRIANSDATDIRLLATMQETYAGYQPGATWSPDGGTIAIPVIHKGKILDSALYCISVHDGSQRKLYSTEGSVGRPLWYPDRGGLIVPLYDPHTGRGQLWTISVPLGVKKRITNDLSDYEMAPDLTPDRKNLAIVEGTGVSNIWASSSAYASKLEQITIGESSMFEAVETNDGRLLVLGGGEIWIMNANGTARASVAKLPAYRVRICGTFIVAAVRQKDRNQIVRLNVDGTHEFNLATGDVYSPNCSPDGDFVFYADTSLPQRILRGPIEGGAPVEIARIPGDGLIGGVELSNDGKSLAFIYEQYTPVPRMFLSVVSSANGSPVKSFTAPPGVNGRLRWSSRDTALQYVLTRNGIDNLWEQNLAGGSPKQLTKFTSGLIFNFNWSKGGKRLLLARGSETSDVVLLTHLR